MEKDDSDEALARLRAIDDAVREYRARTLRPRGRIRILADFSKQPAKIEIRPHGVAAPLTRSVSATPEIELPPRLVFDGLLRRLMNPKTYRQIVEPKIADMHSQYFERLAARDKSGARWAWIRGNYYATPKWLRLIVAKTLLFVTYGLESLGRWLF